MITLDEMLDSRALDQLVADGFIARKSHPTAPLHLYDYTQRAQFERMWTPETLACRGLIVHEDGTVWARPFGKFFNAAEHETLPTQETFEVYDKLDGSAEFFADKPNRAVLFRMMTPSPTTPSFGGCFGQISRAELVGNASSFGGAHQLKRLTKAPKAAGDDPSRPRATPIHRPEAQPRLKHKFFRGPGPPGLAKTGPVSGRALVRTHHRTRTSSTTHLQRSTQGRSEAT